MNHEHNIGKGVLNIQRTNIRKQGYKQQERRVQTIRNKGTNNNEQGYKH